MNPRLAPSLASLAIAFALGGPLPAAAADLKSQCAGCHALTKPEAENVDRLWDRKGPDLWYAGDKFNRDWLVKWLQSPTTVRPGGTMWFRNAHPGEPRDTINEAAAPKHLAVNAGDAAQLADALLQLKSTGLAPAGTYNPAAANPAMGKLAFSKLRGCVACHQDKPGSGGQSGPQLYDAGQRLKPDFVLAYIKDPQQFDRYVWMPRLGLSDADLQRITGYVASLGGDAK